MSGEDVCFSLIFKNCRSMVEESADIYVAIHQLVDNVSIPLLGFQSWP